MEEFTFVSSQSQSQAIRAAAASPTAQLGATVRFVAGGTNLVDLMKLNVERPRQVIDINALGMNSIETLPHGELRLGALTRNADVAHHPVVQRDYAVLSQAILSGASPQIRNMATTGGNLVQRTRCVYFRDTAHRCNKREPGSGCDAMDGYNRMQAILGTSEQCIGLNPSDQNVALMALEATIQITGTSRVRSVPIGEFYRLPGTTPHIETVLEPGDLITSVTLPRPEPGTKSLYLKLRDRSAYEFALASAAVVLGTDGGTIRHVRVALGGVGTIPWRSHEAEAELIGKPADEVHFRQAAEAALRDAKPRSGNAFKVELTKRCIVHTLATATA
jgi:xanthine dehydrogenase YagS FAD-binding subunit